MHIRHFPLSNTPEFAIQHFFTNVWEANREPWVSEIAHVGVLTTNPSFSPRLWWLVHLVRIECADFGCRLTARFSRVQQQHGTTARTLRPCAWCGHGSARGSTRGDLGCLGEIWHSLASVGIFWSNMSSLSRLIKLPMFQTWDASDWTDLSLSNIVNQCD